MENPINNTDDNGKEEAAPVLLDLDLNFVPEWARKPTQNDYFNYEPREGKRGRGAPSYERGRERGRPSGQDSRSDKRAPGPSSRRGGERPSSGDRDRAPRQRPPAGAAPAYPRERARMERVEPPPVNVRFIPLSKAISAIARKLIASRRAHPIMQIASLYLSKPETCSARIEVDKSAPDLFMLQCKICGMIALTQDILERHMVSAHIDEYMDRVEEQREPPAGVFTSVAQCGLSGIFLGPSNHHSYAQKLREIYSQSYSNMSLEQYSAKIRTLRDEESIAKWKQEYSLQVGYRPKGTESAELMTRIKAEAWFLENIAPAHVQKTRRAALPVPLCRSIEDKSLQEAIKNEWFREQGFPISIMMALRGAFNSKGLYIFKAGKGKGITFVTSIPLAPMKTEHVTTEIKEVMQYLQDHPGSSRDELAKALRPDAEPGSDKVNEILVPLSWLIDKGHIIEFFDGTLSVPAGK